MSLVCFLNFGDGSWGVVGEKRCGREWIGFIFFIIVFKFSFGEIKFTVKCRWRIFRFFVF